MSQSGGGQGKSLFTTQRNPPTLSENNTSNLDDTVGPNTRSGRSLRSSPVTRYYVKKPSPMLGTHVATEDVISPFSPNAEPKLSFMSGRPSGRPSSRLSSELTTDFNLETNITHKPFPLSSECPLILGSSSKSRKQVLELIKWPFTIMSPDIDERAIRCNNPTELPRLIAIAKAKALVERLKAEKVKGPLILLTADQVVVFQNQVREKPLNDSEAKTFLSSYSNDYVSTVSAVVATHYPSERQACDVDVAHVFWNEIPQDAVERVVARREIFSSAGGFRIEDPDLNLLLRDIDGSLDSVVGLPVAATARIIEIVKDDVTFQLHKLSSQILGETKAHADEFEDLSLDRKSLDSPFYVRKQAMRSWNRSRSATDLSSTRDSRVRALTGQDGGELPPYAPTGRPSSPTDRSLSPISAQLALRKSPAGRSLRGSRNPAHSNNPPQNPYDPAAQRGALTLVSDMLLKPTPIPSTVKLIFGSDSVIKRRVLDTQGWSYQALKPTFTQFERGVQFESPVHLIEQFVRAEAATLMTHLKDKKTTTSTVVITTKQVYIFQGTMFDIPKSEAEARGFLTTYSGRDVMSLTAVCATHFPSERQAIDKDVAKIHFSEISSDVIAKLLKKQDVIGRVGAINVEDADMNPLILKLDGSIDSVFGVPVDVITRLSLNVLDVAAGVSSAPSLLVGQSAVKGAVPSHGGLGAMKRN